jgi:hypothetical protein
MLITILAMIKLTAAQTQIRLLRLIPGWKYASRSGPYHVGQGSTCTLGRIDVRIHKSH